MIWTTLKINNVKKLSDGVLYRVRAQLEYFFFWATKNAEPSKLKMVTEDTKVDEEKTWNISFHQLHEGDHVILVTPRGHCVTTYTIIV